MEATNIYKASILIQNQKQYRESVERRLLHLVGGLITDGEDSDAVAGSKKLFGEVEADHGVSAAVGIDNEDLLLGSTGTDGEGREAWKRVLLLAREGEWIRRD